MKHIKSYKTFENMSTEMNWKEEFMNWSMGKRGLSHYLLDDFKKEMQDKGEWKDEWNKEYADYRDQLQVESF